jgi:hypothetical protein
MIGRKPCKQRSTPRATVSRFFSEFEKLRSFYCLIYISGSQIAGRKKSGYGHLWADV